MGVDFLFHHGNHVKSVSHCIETKDFGKSLEACPVKRSSSKS